MLPRDLKAALNRYAHAEGQRHAEAVKTRLLADLERMKSAGASLADLLAHIERQAGADR